MSSLKIRFSTSLSPSSVLVIPVLGGVSTESVQSATINALLSTMKFKGEVGKIVPLLGLKGKETVVALGLGKKPHLSALALEKAGAALVKWLDSCKVEEASVSFLGKGLSEKVSTPGAFLANGAFFARYVFEGYKTKPKPKPRSLQKLSVAVGKGKIAGTKASLSILSAVREGVFFARELQEEPGNVMTPAEVAHRTEKALKPLGVAVTIYKEAALKKLGMQALLAVGRGSVNESYMVTLQWRGGDKKEKQAPLCLVGKGVTFDTGGISLKPSAGMQDMKYDMGGAAAVVGTFMALAKRKAPLNVSGALGLVENMPSGRAQRPGDIVTSLSGQTIAVNNTDAEGRLVLADVLHYMQEHHTPDVLINLATLTGAILVPLGHEFGGLFTNNQAVGKRLIDSGKIVGEKLWLMPMDAYFEKAINDPIADMTNTSTIRWGGSSTAAHFLKRFIKSSTKWCHLDIAGVAFGTPGGPLTPPKTATGWGVRLLHHYISTCWEKK